MGSLHVWGKWNAELLEDIGVKESQLPTVVPMCQPPGNRAGHRHGLYGRIHRRLM